jgi:hypothetical protein
MDFTKTREFIHETLGVKHAENLRKIISDTVEKEWQIPGKRFSPLLREHLLYFIAKQRNNLFSHLFPEILEIKFQEEYGYGDCPAVLPRLIEDLTSKIRLYFAERGKETLAAPPGTPNSLKVRLSPFQEAFQLYLEQIAIDDQFRESIREQTGLPAKFLKKIFDDFEKKFKPSANQSKQELLKLFLRFMATKIEN